MFRTLKKLLAAVSPCAADSLMSRWSQDRLLQTKVYLETKDPATFTREDQYLTAEYLFMRYLPEDDQRTEAQWQAVRSELHRKIDLNIDYPDGPKEPVKDDPEFAEWLKQTLSKKIDRTEILQMFECFDQECANKQQTQALRMFKFWLEHPDNFRIDGDLRKKMEAIVLKYTMP